jgi:cytochrome c oxidase subunit 4
MVLDSKQMEWASREGLDTAALKKAKVPIYGKWYFPDLPANVPLVNLSTGEVETFPAGYRAGAVLYVKDDDLKRLGLGPYKNAPAPAAAAAPAAALPAEAPVAVAVAAAPPAPPAPAPAPAPAPVVHHEPAHVAPAAHPEPSHGPAHGGGHAAVHAAEHAHPGARTYIVIALILTFITAVEVAVYYIPALLPYIFLILLTLSVVKFLMVVGWFMHLKFDHVSFSWYFGGGLALALIMVMSLIVLQIATHGVPPGDGHAVTHPSTYPGVQPPGGSGASTSSGGH